jgi:hypothetical protein
MKERRTKERRSFQSRPAVSGKGNKRRSGVADRRRIPDRRLNSIRVEYISLGDFYNSRIHLADYS